MFPELLRSPIANVQFYAANAIYAKVCSGWTSLPQQQQPPIYNFLWGAMNNAKALSVAALRRLCLALAAAAVLTKAPGTVSEYIQRAIGPLTQAASGASAVDPALCLACVELLLDLPEEAADKPISNDRSERVRSEMVAASEHIFSALQTLLAAPASPFTARRAVEAASSAAASADPAAKLVLEGVTACYKATGAWLELGGITAGALSRKYSSLMQVLLQGMLTVPVASVAHASSEALNSALTVRVHPREAGRDDAIAMVAIALVSSTDYIAAALAAQKWDLLSPVAVTASTLATYEDKWMAVDAAAAPVPPSVDIRRFPNLLASLDPPLRGSAPVSPSSTSDAPCIGGVPVGLGCYLGDLLLQLTSVPSFKVAEATVDCLMGAQSLPVADRHPFFRRHAFAHLLRIVLSQCAYRIDPATGSVPRSLDPDEFMSFRSSRGAAVDALIDCTGALQGGFVATVADWLKEQQQHRPGGYPQDKPGRSQPWLALESVLHCLTSVASDVSDMLEQAEMTSDDYDDNDATPSAGRELDGSLQETVVSLMLVVCTSVAAASSSPVSSSCYAEVLSSACAWIGGMCHWLAGLEPGKVLRYSTAPPFSCLAGGPPFGTPLQQQPAPTDAGLEASFGTIPASVLVEQLLHLLLVCLQRTASNNGGVPLLRSKPRRDDMHTIAGLAGSSIRKAAPAAASADVSGTTYGTDASGSGSDDDDSVGGGDDDGDDELGAAGEDDGGATVAWRAAEALLPFCRATRQFLQASPTALQSLAEGVASAVASGLHLLPCDKAHRAIIEVCGAISDAQRKAAAFAAVLAPQIARVGGVAAAAAAAAPDNSAKSAPSSFSSEELALCREVALATSAIHLAESTASSGSGSSLDQLGDAVWRACEVALPALHSRREVVGVLLQGLRGTVRYCPAVPLAQPGRIPSLLSLAVQLYQMHLYPDALAVVEAAIQALPGMMTGAVTSSSSSSPLQLPPDVVASCQQLMAAVSAATASAAGLAPPISPVTASSPPAPQLADEPESLREYLRLCDTVLDVVPVALVMTSSAASSSPCLPLALQLMGHGIRGCDKDTGKACAVILRTLLTKDALRQNPEWAAVIDSSIASAGASLVSSLLAALMDDRSTLTGSFVIEMLQSLFTAYADKGVVQLVTSALEQLASPAGAGGSLPAASAAADAETGIECLLPAERAALIATAGQFAGKQPHKFKMLLTDLGKIARRQLTKDALLSYGI